MKVYLAGPMTGIEDYNHPAFYQGESILMAQGFTVVNPAKLDAVTAEEIEGPGGLGEGSMLPAYLRRDFKELVHCDGLVLLDGYKWSPGANAELAVARWLDMKVWRLKQKEGWKLVPSSAMPNPGVVADTWQRFGYLVYLEQRRQERWRKQSKK